jgi:hypothetical protein
LWYYVVFLSGSRYWFIPVLPLYIQLSRGECYDPISGFKPVILLFLSQVRNYLHLKVVGNGHFVLFVQCSTESVTYRDIQGLRLSTIRRIRDNFSRQNHNKWHEISQVDLKRKTNQTDFQWDMSKEHNINTHYMHSVVVQDFVSGRV